MQATYTCHAPWVEVPGGEERKSFANFSAGHTTSGGTDAVTAPTGAQHVT